MTDDELTDVWESGHLGRAVTHGEHVRIAWVIITRHGKAAGTRRIADSTLRNCIAMEAADRFDPELTALWSEAIASATASSNAATATEFLEEHPELLNSRLLGLPAWMITPS